MTYEELDSMLTMHLGAKPWIAACEFLYVESERQDKLREELAAELQEANKKLKSRKRPANTDSQQKEIDRLKHIIERREEQLSDAIQSHENTKSAIEESIKDALGIDARKQPLIQNVKHLCNRLKQAEATLPSESDLQNEITAMRDQFFRINAICESAGFSTFTESYADQVQAVVDAYLAKKGISE